MNGRSSFSPYPMKQKFVFDAKKRKIKRRIKWRDVLLDFSFGMINKVCDLALISLFLGEASLTSGGMAKRFAYTASKLIEEFPGVDIRALLEGLRTVRRNRWVDGNLHITEEGRLRLRGIIPTVDLKKDWNGIWCVVIFDIPEKFNKKRNILREKLKILGFGRLQDSVWISPTNLLGTIQNEVESMDLGPFVLCAQTSTFGESNARELATRVWALNDLKNRYEKFLEAITEKRKILSSNQAFFWYLSIAKDDPFLPSELLPNDWPGFVAHKFMSTGIMLKHHG